MKTTTTIAACLVAALCAQGQNLILNGDFEAGNTSFTNDYLYSPLDMQPAGTYCVTNDPGLVHGAWTSFGDHTTGAGLMLVANGDAEPTNVVWRQTVNVSPNAGHLFSAWAASAYTDSPGRFFLFVNGVQQGNVVELPSTTGVWQNYSVIWSSEASVSALLEVRLLTTESYGNDFVLDDLSFRGLTVAAPPPRLSIQKAVAGAAVELSWPSVTNQLYQLQWADEVATNQWFSLGPPLAGNGSTNSIVDLLGSNSKRFYRVVPVN
ncbi:MAG: hypothetical protein NT154_17635 [Verrucomicrobia bacterium]|nr:hypothetical protein [Verrucomicrobiota bacterium]